MCFELLVITHMDQNWDARAYQDARNIGARTIRDEISWGKVERRPGRFSFQSYATRYIDDLESSGLDILLLINNYGAQPYDEGGTPHSPEALDAFQGFIEAVLARFPSVTRLEIGNEFNGDQFVTGHVRDAGYGDRDIYYMNILNAAYAATENAGRDITLIGGATHSIPLGYLGELFEQGGLDVMDGVSIHPYTTDPEHMGRQLELLRLEMGDTPVPVHATEFSREMENADDVPAYVVKMTAAMAEAGVASAAWYALWEEPWYKNTGLYDFSGRVTPAGEAYTFMQSVLGACPVVTDISPDPFAYAYKIGDDTLVMWGEGHGLRFTQPVIAYDARGRVLDAPPQRLNPNDPVIVVLQDTPEAGHGVVFGDSGILADSYHQFHPDDRVRGSSPWRYFHLRDDGEFQPLRPMGGGQIASENWTPHRGNPWLRPLSMHEHGLMPVAYGDNPDQRFAIVERYVAPEAMRARVEGSWKLTSANSPDGARLTVRHNDEVLMRRVLTDEIILTLDDVELAAGDTLDFIVDVNETSQGGDAVHRRVQVLRPGGG